MEQTFKRVVLSLMLLFFVTTTADAVPAKRGAMQVVQADGSTITILRHGDEFFHYTTTLDGHIIDQKNGIYYYADISPVGEVLISNVKANNQASRSSAERVFLSSKNSSRVASFAGELNRQRRNSWQLPQRVQLSRAVTGEGRGIVILVQFPDKYFKITNPKEHFYDMLNKKDYMGIGSVKDYFFDNSGGLYTPSFDVSDVIMLDKGMAYYGANGADGNDLRVRELVAEACRKASAAGVDFSKYDNNNDGVVDNVYIYYAGYNEAEGASTETIWPHSWEVNEYVVLNGKRISRYACSSELKSFFGGNPAGIGTFCHEYGHLIGLYDLYDVNGDKNGSAKDLSVFDLMARGNYCGNGDCPSSLSSISRMLLGWCEVKSMDGIMRNYVLEPLNKIGAYRIETDVDGEYFLLENRNGDASVWDAQIGGNGLLIYHVDRSAMFMNRWNTNEVNRYADHPCAYIISASGNLDNYKNIPYPCVDGKASKWTATTVPSTKSWSGQTSGIELLDIRRDGMNILFRAGSDIESGVSGQVVNREKVPLVDAIVTFVSSENKNIAQTVTDKEGTFIASGVPVGTYRVRVEMKDYLSYENRFKVSKGDYLTIKLFRASDVQLTSFVSQTGAIFRWKTMDYTSWHVEWRTNGSDVLSSTETDTNVLELSNLLPDTDYTLSLYGYNSASRKTDKIADHRFRTVARKSDIPVIQLKYNYSINEEIPLVVFNTTGSDRVEWRIDGVKQSQPIVTLSAGKHEVRCLIGRGDKKITVIRKIEVK